MLHVSFKPLGQESPLVKIQERDDVVSLLQIMYSQAQQNILEAPGHFNQAQPFRSFCENKQFTNFLCSNVMQCYDPRNAATRRELSGTKFVSLIQLSSLQLTEPHP